MATYTTTLRWYLFLFLCGITSTSLQREAAAFQPVPTTGQRQRQRAPIQNHHYQQQQQYQRCFELASCPVLELTRPSNNSIVIPNIELPLDAMRTSATSTTTTVTTTPKMLGKWSGFRFTLASLRGKPHKYLAHLQRKHGENFIIPANGQSMVVLNNAKAIRDVLETHNLPKTPKVRFGYKSIFYGTKGRSSSGGILAAPWNKWLAQRRMAAPALAESVIGELAPKFYNVSWPFFVQLEARAQRQQPVDMAHAFTAVTMDAIGQVLLGKSFGMCHSLHYSLLEGTQPATTEVPFATALHRLTDEAVRQMILPGWWLRRRPKDREVEAARRIIDDFLEDCMATRLADLAKETSRSNTTDLLNILLEAEANGLMKHDEVKGQLLQFVFAGFDTLAPTLTYMLWEISQNQNLQKELAKEARAALPSKEDFPWNPDMLKQQFPLLDRTFSETNRKHPAAALGSSRSVGKKALVVGDGLELPENSVCLMPPWTLHRNENYWPDPETFDPSRFEAPMEDPYAYQPFSGGPRNCIGIRLARAETLSLFAPLLRRYEIHCDSSREPNDSFSLTRRPRKKVMFRLIPRAD